MIEGSIDGGEGRVAIRSQVASQRAGGTSELAIAVVRRGRLDPMIYLSSNEWPRASKLVRSVPRHLRPQPSFPVNKTSYLVTETCTLKY
jgi:hypothetical protein